MTGGIDGYYTEFTNKEGYGTAPSLNLASLDYSRGIARPDYTVAEEQTQRQLGLYLQDIIEIDRLTVALGARHDWVKTETATGAPGDLGEAEDQSDDAFTGRAGVSYLFDNGIAPYASYSTSFSPNIGLNPDGSAFVPTTAEQYELGVKYQVPDVNLLVSAAIYQIEQEKGVFLQPSADFSTSVQVQLDKLRSRGFEIEAAAGLADGLNLTLSYASLDMEIIEGVPGTEGNTLSSRPQHTAAAYVDYTVQNGFAKGFGIGGGVRFVGESFGTTATASRTMRGPMSTRRCITTCRRSRGCACRSTPPTSSTRMRPFAPKASATPSRSARSSAACATGSEGSTSRSTTWKGRPGGPPLFVPG